MFNFSFKDDRAKIKPNYLTTMAHTAHASWGHMVFELRVDHQLAVTRRIRIEDTTFEFVSVDCKRHDDGHVDVTLWISQDIAEYCLSYYQQYEGAFMVGGRTMHEGLAGWKTLWDKREMDFAY